VHKLFIEGWNDIISTIEKILTPSETQLASFTGSVYQDTENDRISEEVKQYTKDVTTNVSRSALNWYKLFQRGSN
ncbi:8686_t:CDS:2, partial [Racocetra persica]